MWEVASGREAGVLRGHVQEVRALAYLPDGSGLVSGCRDGSVWLWSAQLPPATTETVRTAAGVSQFAFLPDGRSAAVVKADYSVEVWNLADLKMYESLGELGTDNFMVAPSPDGALFAVGGWVGGRVSIWERRHRRLLKTFQVTEEDGPVYVEFTSDGRQLVAAARDSRGSIARWEIATWTQTGVWQLGGDPLAGDLSSSGQLAAAGMNDGTLAVLECDSGRVARLRSPGRTITGVGFSPDETLLATGSEQGMLVLWDTKIWRPLGPPLGGHRRPIYQIGFCADGRRIATPGTGGEEAVILWDVATRRPVATLSAVGTSFNWASFSPDGNTIAAVARGEGTLYLWHAPSWNAIAAAETSQSGP